jgi:nitric oxide reductase NorD protein
VSGIEFEPWEPEESVGKLWHAFASRLDAPTAHESAAVELRDLSGRLAIFFHGLGGPAGAAIAAAARETAAHRLSWRRRLGVDAERSEPASWDGEALRLPERIAAFPDRDANAALYFWLAAAAAHAPAPVPEPDPLRRDLRALWAARTMTAATLADCPGLTALHARLAVSARAARPRAALPAAEAAVEAAAIALLGGPAPDGGLGRAYLARIAGAAPDLEGLAAPAAYRSMRAVPLWPDLRVAAERSAPAARDDEAGSGASAESGTGALKAKRRAADAAERRDSLILHKFEAILSWADFLNLNRRVEDDDDDGAKKAADDVDEIALGQVSKRPATRLRLHLDLAPEDADREALAGKHLHPEWDHRAAAYLPDHVRVLASPAPEAPGGAPPPDPAAARRIRAVRRQFDALRPKRVHLSRQVDGEEIDLEAAVEARVALRATGRCSDRVYRAARSQGRDLAVSILLDTSRSTEGAVANRSVIDVEKEALTAMAWGLHACGDEAAIHAFSSLRRDRVTVLGVKGFAEPMGAAVEARIAGLAPGQYTRLGAAIRHVSAGLALRPRARRLLLVITDGKPNDLDHYEGRHGIEDSRMAVREARMRGASVHGVIVGAKSEAWLPRIFGRGGFSVIPDPERLTGALPEIYRHLAGTA